MSVQASPQGAKQRSGKLSAKQTDEVVKVVKGCQFYPMCYTAKTIDML